jgi:hypothetical protein
MAALTKTQLDHAKQRVSEAKQKLIERRIAMLGPRPNHFDLTTQEQIAHIKTGTATLKTDMNFASYTKLVDAFDYRLTAQQQGLKNAYDTWAAKADAIKEAATAIEQNLIDELVMSPDGVSALQRITAAFAD